MIGELVTIQLERVLTHHGPGHAGSHRTRLFYFFHGSFFHGEPLHDPNINRSATLATRTAIIFTSAQNRLYVVRHGQWFGVPASAGGTSAFSSALSVFI